MVHLITAENGHKLKFDYNAAAQKIAWNTFGHDEKDRVREIQWDNGDSTNWDEALEIEV